MEETALVETPRKEGLVVASRNPYIGKGEIYAATAHLYTLVDQQLQLLSAAGAVHVMLPPADGNERINRIRAFIWTIVENFMNNKQTIQVSLGSIQK